MRKLLRLRPGIHVAQWIVLALEGERPFAGPRLLDQVDRLPELLALDRRRRVVVERLLPAAGREPGNDAAVRHVIEHGVLLRHAQRVTVQRQEVGEHDDLAVTGLLGQRRGDDVWRRHQPVDVLVMLVQHHPVETDGVGVSELVDVAVE